METSEVYGEVCGGEKRRRSKGWVEQRVGQGGVAELLHGMKRASLGIEWVKKT